MSDVGKSKHGICGSLVLSIRCHYIRILDLFCFEKKSTNDLVHFFLLILVESGIWHVEMVMQQLMRVWRWSWVAVVQHALDQQYVKKLTSD